MNEYHVWLTQFLPGKHVTDTGSPKWFAIAELSLHSPEQKGIQGSITVDLEDPQVWGQIDPPMATVRREMEVTADPVCENLVKERLNRIVGGTKWVIRAGDMRRKPRGWRACRIERSFQPTDEPRTAKSTEQPFTGATNHEA